MQMLNDVNGMAEDLSRPSDFAIILVSPEAMGREEGRTEVRQQPF